MASVGDNETVWVYSHPFYPDPLTGAVDEALSQLPLHLEKSVREAFGLSSNPMLEDVKSGNLEEAIQFLQRTEVSETLREFLNR